MGEPNRQPHGFLAGTLIGTTGGPVPVEELGPKHNIVCLSGTEKYERILHWVSQERPVLIKQGGLTPLQPSEDLYLSERECVYLNGHLDAAGNLRDGRRIVRARRQPSYEYWNVRLPKHSVIMANGLPCESYFLEGEEEPCVRRFPFRPRLTSIRRFARGGGLLVLYPRHR